MARAPRGNAAKGKPPYNRQAAKKTKVTLPAAAAIPAKGRPPGYKPEYDLLAERMSLLIMTDEEICKIIGISLTTMHRWDIDHPSFRTARVRGREEADGEVVAALKHRARGYSHPAVRHFLGPGGTVIEQKYIQHYPPDTNAAALWLSNRQGGKWKLRPGEEKNPDGVGITIKVEGGLPDD
jgi:hypothetical protein